MSPVSRRTGRRYTAGSDMSKAGYEEVKMCATCGQRLLLAHNAQWETDVRTGVRRGWHTVCGRPA